MTKKAIFGNGFSLRAYNFEKEKIGEDEWFVWRTQMNECINEDE